MWYAIKIAPTVNSLSCPSLRYSAKWLHQYLLRTLALSISCQNIEQVTCVCMYVYTLPPWRLSPSARCMGHTWGVRINDVMLWVSVRVFLPSSFIFVYKNVIFHLQRRNWQHTDKLEKNDMIYLALEKVIYIGYIDIAYTSASTQNRQLTKRY